MAGAYATAALNVGAAVGPAVAGLSLGTGLGLQGPAWIAAGLVAVALVLCRHVRTSERATRSE